MTLSKTTHNRRSFLKASALAGGGFMLGFSWKAAANPTIGQLSQVTDEWIDMNAFLKIANNGVVTILSPNPEIGQNVKTAMPMIVAEELDVAWKDVVVEQAGLDTEKFSRQVAGGSQSIRQSWKGLRTAGATARRMLMEAAAKKWNVPLSELTTDAGVIHHKKSKKSMGYGEIASAAASLPVPKDVSLKDPKDFKIIGTSQKNVDLEKIIVGEPLYGMDVQKEGMLIAMIEHAPAFGMKLKSLDASKAKSLPGIRDVITIDTAPKDRQWSDVSAFPKMVAIVGDSTWQVMKAKKALKIEWEEASALESSSDHEKSMSEFLNKPSEKPARKDGDPDAAFEKAAKLIERTYSAPFLPHNTMEPMNFFANVTADKAELEGPVQTPESLRRSVASVLGMTEDKISIMLTRMGGGFGRRLYGNFGVEAAIISQKVNAPVKLIYSREDDMTQGTYRPCYKVTYRAALDENNKLIAWHARGVGVDGSPLFQNRYPAGTVDNFLIENHNLESNITTGAWRAPRSNFIASAEQSFIDEVAEAAGKDPIDFRLELFERAMKNPVGNNNDYDAARYAGVLKLVKEKSNWDKPMLDVHRGVSAYYCHNSYVAQIVDVVMKEDKPVIKKVWCAVDCGIVINPDSARNEIEGGIIDGIGHAMFGGISFKDGEPEQNNFNKYRLIRYKEAPLEIETFFVKNEIDPTGLGEPSLPPVGAALANAMYKATGERWYEQPYATKPQPQPKVE